MFNVRKCAEWRKPASKEDRACWKRSACAAQDGRMREAHGAFT